MPRTDLTVQTASRFETIITPTLNAADAANGNSFDNTTRSVILWIVNGSGGDLTVTIDNPQLSDTDLEIPEREYTIPNGGTRVIGPFPSDYNQTDNSLTNRVLVDWSTGTSVTCAVISVPRA